MMLGDQIYRAVFLQRKGVETDMGGTRDEWVAQFTVRAGVQHLRGGEAVMQARLASRNPVIVTIGNSAQARRITSDWRVELRDRMGIVKAYELREDPRPAAQGATLEMLAEG